MKINFNLSLKLTLIVLSISIIIIASLTYINIQEQTRSFEESYSEKATALAQSLDASIQSRSDLEDKQRLQNYILNFILLNKEDVLKVSINLPEDGELKVAVSSDSDYVGNPSTSDNYHSYEKGDTINIPHHSDDSHTLTVITPLHLSGQRVGTYEMLLSMDSSYEALGVRVRNSIIISVLSLFFLVISFLYLLRRTVVRPITAFRVAANKVGEGDLDTEIIVKSNDEIGDLAFAFSKMVKNLKEQQENLENLVAERTKEINSLNINLEKKVEERTGEVKKLLKQKDEFISQLGHDLKTPLTPIITLLPLIKKGVEDDELNELLDVTIQNAEYMKNLVVKTLQLARLNSPNTKFEIEDTNLAGESNKIIANNKINFEKNNVKIENMIDDKIMVKADKLRLDELFYNLFTNAIKYSPNGGTIIIDAQKEDDVVTVSVTDNGMGLTKEQLSHIFDEFYKVDESRHDFYSSGLGLSICKRIVEKHGGRIWAESLGPGKGSKISFTIESSNKKDN